MNFDLQTYLKDIKSRQKCRYEKSQTRSSIDTESLFTDRSESCNPSRYPYLKYQDRPVAVKVIEIHKPYILEDFFPKSYKPCQNYPKSSSQRSNSVLSNKENFSLIQDSSSKSKPRDWENTSFGKISSRNPLTSFDYPSDTSPSPNPVHLRKPTADFPQPYKPSEKPQNIPLTLCTCILSGKLYRHLKGCKKVSVIVTKGKVCKKFSVVEACILIQREFRRYLRKKYNKGKESIDFPFFVDVSRCRPKRVLSSVLDSYSFSKDSEIFVDLESDRFMNKMIVPDEILKDFRSDFEESIDFELSNTFK